MPSKIVKTASEIRDDILRTVSNGLARLGKFLNIGPGTDEYIRAEAFAQFGSVILANVEAAEEAKMPDTAGGEDLNRLLANYDLSRRPAGPSYGFITIVSGGATLVVEGAELSSPQGIIFRVTQGGIYSNGDVIPVGSVDVGAKTNLELGTILKWANPPYSTNPTAELSTAPTGGVDEETDEVARQRLLAHLANPPAAANWSWCTELAISTDPSVQSAFDYPSANGPGTNYITVAAAPSEFSKTRVVPTEKLNSIIIPTIIGEMPVGVETVVQTVTDVPTDVSYKLSIPVSVAGWKDPSPFPQVDGVTYTYVAVTVVTSTTDITIAAPTAPVAGVSRISWIDRSSYTVKEATITSFSGSGPYQLTLNTPFVGIQVGDWIMPASNNLQVYVDAILAYFALMGPGEKTNASAVLPRALRHPLPNESYPNRIDAGMLKALISASDEVQTADFYYRQNTSPSMPATIDDNANILIPNQLGFYL